MNTDIVIPDVRNIAWHFHTAIILIITFLTGTAIYAVSYSFLGIEQTLSYWDLLLISGIYTTVFVVLFQIIKFITRDYIEFSKANIILSVIVYSVILILGFLLAGYISLAFYPSLEVLQPDSNTFWAIFGVSFAGCLIGSTIYLINEYHQRLLISEKAILQSQMDVLKAQINPHFLFNTLNSITSLIEKKPEKAVEITESLGNIFHYTLQISERDIVSLENELETIEEYLLIEKARFGNRLLVFKNIDESLLNIKLPGLIIQPLVENAIKHGLTNKGDNFSLFIDIQKKRSILTIKIHDNGVGFDTVNKEQLYKRGTGLKNITNRLKTHYGKFAELDIRKNSVTIQIQLTS